MTDRTYTEALAAAPAPHRVLLGPVQCMGCGQLVEWAGVAWLDAATTVRHQCPPGSDGASWRQPVPQTRPRSGFLQPRYVVGPVPVVRSARLMQAHPKPWPPEVLFAVLLIVAALVFAAASWAPAPRG